MEEFIISLHLINVHFLKKICRMEPFHLLDLYYEEHHRGRLTAEGEVTYSVMLLYFFALHMYLCSRINLINSIVYNYCTLFVLEPMIGSRTCGTTIGTLLSLRGLA